MLISGSCLCGGVGYQLEDDAVLIISHCHCSSCRKASGAAFATFLMVLLADFAWIKGEQLVNKYESSKGIFRCHCDLCGSPLPMLDPHLSLMVVPAGSLDTPTNARSHIETFTDDALSFLQNKYGNGLGHLFQAALDEVSKKALADKLSSTLAPGSGREAKAGEELNLEFLSFRQRESKAYWKDFLDKVNARRAELGLGVFADDFLEQLAQRGDIG